MPIYEFHCRDCEHDSEILVRSSNWEGTACPQCGSKKLAKKFSVFAASGTGGVDSGTCDTGGTSPGGTGGGCCGGHCGGHGN